MPPIDSALNAELLQLYRELARATMEAPPLPRGAPANAAEEKAFERWRMSRDNVARIKTRIREITGEH
jgi:hypothetical protein